MNSPIIGQDQTARQVVIILTDNENGTTNITTNVFPPMPQPSALTVPQPITGAVAMLHVAIDAIQKNGKQA